MRLITLWLSLQSLGPSAADTAEARAYLSAGVAEYPPATRGSGLGSLEQSLQGQLWQWGLGQTALRLAPDFDRNVSSLHRRSRTHRLQAVERLLATRDTAAIWTMVNGTLQPDRDSLLADMARRAPDSATAYAFESRIFDGGLRGGIAYDRGLRALSQRDSATARRLIREAINLATRNPHPAVNVSAWSAMLFVAGGDITLPELMALTDADPRQRFWRRYEVLNVLTGHRRAEARPLVDSLIAEAMRDTSRRGPGRQALALDLRGTSEDSLRARDARQVAYARNPAPSPFTYTPPRTQVVEATARLDTALLHQEMARTVPPVELHEALTGIRQRQLQTASNRASGLPMPEPDQPYAPVLLRLSEPHLNQSTGLWHDSVAVAWVRVMSFVNAEAALAKVATIDTPRLKDRALAAVAEQVAILDSDSALRLVASIQDDSARNAILPLLALRAIAGGQHPLAQSLAERTPAPEHRVKIHAGLAESLLPGQPDEAQRHILNALQTLDPRTSCHHCIQVVPLGQPVPPWMGMSSFTIEPVLDLAVRLLSSEQLDTWIASLPDAEHRIWARVALADAFSRKYRGPRQLFWMRRLRP